MTDSQSDHGKDQESLLGHSQPYQLLKSCFSFQGQTRLQDDIEEFRSMPRKSSFLLKIFKIVGGALVFTLAISGMYCISEKMYQSYRDRELVQESKCECIGSTPEEAIANGCRFDGLALFWLPAHCRDDELSAEFGRMGDGPGGAWKYYDDPDLTIELPLEDVIMRAWERVPDSSVYTHTKWHIAHCIYSWRREHKSRIDGKILDPFAKGEGHIKHCGMNIMNPAAKSKVTY